MSRLMRRARLAALGGWTPAKPTTDGGLLPSSWSSIPDLIGYVDSDLVPTLPDLSGNGVVFSALGSARATYKAAQLNGMPVLRFNGSTNYYSAGDKLDFGTAGLAVFTVGKQASTATTQYWIGKTRADAQTGRWNVSSTSVGRRAFMELNEDVVLLALGSTITTAYEQRTALFDRTTAVTVRVGGAVDASDSGSANADDLGTANECWIGAAQPATGLPPPVGGYLDGDLAEVLVYHVPAPGVMSADDIAQVEGYQTARYAL